MSFWIELKRRNVYRAAVFYAGAAWLLVQIATQVFPFFHIEEWVVRWIVIAAVIGFPFAMLFSWFYEWTPEGIKRDSDVNHDASNARRIGKKFDRWIIAVLGLAVVLLLADKFVWHKSTADAVDQSIAVLPFANLSTDTSNAYFATGIQDEILTRLAKIGALKVISRTSTQHYASSPDNLPEIARQLGVANLVEGSVQKSGDQVRINVQLIQAGSDSHLWAETYDRKLTDVFGVESEVASAIADALQAKLTGGERQDLARKPTTNPAAYDAYLRGLAIEARGYGSQDETRSALAYFTQATQLDPQFALAWVHLSVIKSYMTFNLIDRTPTLLAEAKQAADTAMTLQPDSGEALWAIGAYRYWGLQDFDGGLDALQKASERLPNDTNILLMTSLIERRQGKWDEAVEHTVRAVERDPRNIALLASLSGYYGSLRQFDRALATLDKALAVAPGDINLIAAKIGTYQVQGNLDAADALLATVPIHPDGSQIYNAQIQQLLYRRRFDDLIANLKTATAQPDSSLGVAAASYFGNLGFALWLSGNVPEARAAFTESLQRLQAFSKEDASSILIPSYLALAYAGLGDKENALRQAERGVALAAKDAVNKPQAEAYLAQVQGVFGENDAAIAAIPHLLDVPSGITLAQLKLDPIWDPLRKDPRFQKIVDDAEKAAATKKNE